MRVLIAGAGDIGVRAGMLLAAAGCQVTGLKRRGSLAPPLATYHADLGDRASLRGLSGVAIDTLAFLPAPDQRTPDAYRRLYRDGFIDLIDALGATPRRVVYVSSTAVYHDSGATIQDERSAPEPAAWNGAALLDAECTARERCGETLVVLRLAGIYGPGRAHAIERARRGEGCRHTPPHYTCRIHADDAAAAVAHLLRLDAPAPVYIGVDDEPALDCDVARYLGQLLKVDAPNDASQVALSDAALARATGKRLSNARLKASGWTPRFPSYREGYAALVAAASL